MVSYFQTEQWLIPNYFEGACDLDTINPLLLLLLFLPDNSTMEQSFLRSQIAHSSGEEKNPYPCRYSNPRPSIPYPLHWLSYPCA